MAFTETVVYDFGADGGLNSVVLSASGAISIDLYFRDLTSTSDRPVIYVSEDGGTTKENATGEYESFHLTLAVPSTAGGNAGFTFTGVVLGNATVGPHDAHVRVEGLASSVIKTDFIIQASDGVSILVRHYNRITANVENALVIENIGGNNWTGGQIIARVET